MRSAEKKLMFSRVLRKAKEERGSAAVEFAMVLPFLLVLLSGIIEFGRVLYYQQVLTNAARESSRASATGFEPYTTAANRVLSPVGIPSPSPSCSSTPPAGQATICQKVVDIPVGSTTTQAHQVANFLQHSIRNPPEAPVGAPRGRL